MRELGIFLRALEKRKPVVYIVIWSRPRSREYRGLSYREEVELMSPRSLGHLPKSHSMVLVCGVHVQDISI